MTANTQPISRARPRRNSCAVMNHQTVGTPGHSRGPGFARDSDEILAEEVLKEPIQIAAARKDAPIVELHGAGLVSKHAQLFHDANTQRRRETEAVEILH